MWWKDTFFDSNFFTGTTTLFVGLLAIILYFWQKKDQKRDAASLILQEIRYAEQKIRTYKESSPNQYNLADRLLPTNSWNDNIHLFIKDLKEGEIDMISAFYAKTKYIDFLILKRSEQKTSSRNTQSQNVVVANPQPLQTAQVMIPVSQQVPHIMQFIMPPSADESVTIDLLSQISFSIELIYNTSIVNKLKNISENRWFNLF